MTSLVEKSTTIVNLKKYNIQMCIKLAAGGADKLAVCVDEFYRGFFYIAM